MAFVKRKVERKMAERTCLFGGQKGEDLINNGTPSKDGGSLNNK